MDTYSIREMMAMTNCRCTVVSVKPGRVFLVGEEVVIKVANILWAHAIPGNLVHFEMVNGLEMHVYPLGPVL